MIVIHLLLFCYESLANENPFSDCYCSKFNKAMFVTIVKPLSFEDYFVFNSLQNSDQLDQWLMQYVLQCCLTPHLDKAQINDSLARDGLAQTRRAEA